MIIIGTGLVFCYRANIWNIGAEGQLIAGAVGAGGLALSFPDTTSVFLLLAWRSAPYYLARYGQRYPRCAKSGSGQMKFGVFDADLCGRFAD